MERNIDCMKYRKSTHLAGVDVEAIIAEKGACILKIKDAVYDKQDVSGKKLDGYFLTFYEDVKPMMVNSTNRKTIASIVKTVKNCSAQESRNIGNWINQSIELIFDENVVMKGEKTGGTRVRPINPIREIDPTNALSIINSSTNGEELAANWKKLSKDEQALAVVVKAKDDLKTKFGIE